MLVPGGLNPRPSQAWSNRLETIGRGMVPNRRGLLALHWSGFRCLLGPALILEAILLTGRLRRMVAWG